MYVSLYLETVRLVKRTLAISYCSNPEAFLGHGLSVRIHSNFYFLLAVWDEFLRNNIGSRTNPSEAPYIFFVFP